MPNAVNMMVPQSSQVNQIGQNSSAIDQSAVDEENDLLRRTDSEDEKDACDGLDGIIGSIEIKMIK